MRDLFGRPSSTKHGRTSLLENPVLLGQKPRRPRKSSMFRRVREKGSFQKIHLLGILENFEILEILENPQTVENKGESVMP